MHYINSNIILASSSPRRNFLLKEAGFKFKVEIPNIDEIEDEKFNICELTDKNAYLKSSYISTINPNNTVIGADTLVHFKGQAIGKPINYDEAKKILNLLSGQIHEVYTSVSILNKYLNINQLIRDTTIVEFKELTDLVIEEYLKKINPLDKAGSYAIQNHRNLIIKNINGSISNAMGLPMKQIKKFLNDELKIIPK